jgi:hypothetical protein
MAGVASKQQTANDSPVFIHHSHTHKKTHRTDKQTNKPDWGNLCCARERSVQFFVRFFTHAHAALCCGLEKSLSERHGRGTARVNQTQPHCANKMVKTRSKPLVERHGRGTAYARHGHGMVCVN